MPKRRRTPVFMSPTGGEFASTLRLQLTLWRTILVDGEAGLPTYQIVGFANQLDSPVWKMHYTYPRDIVSVKIAIDATPDPVKAICVEVNGR